MRLAIFVACAALTAAAQSGAPAPTGAAGASAGGRRALLIAESSYVMLPVVKSPIANVRALDEALRGLHFVTKTLVNPAQANLLQAWDDFTATVQPGDFVLVYFSGFGYLMENRNYLLPVDFDPKATTSAGQRAFSVRKLQELDDRNPSTRMLLFDATRSCAEALKADPGKSCPDLGDGLSSMQQVDDTVIAFSAAEFKTAADPPDGGVDRFTAALIHAIEEPGAKPVQALTSVRAEVKNGSKGLEDPFVAPDVLIDNKPFYFTPPPPPKPKEEPKVIEIIRDAAPKGPVPGEHSENPKDKMTYSWIPPGKFMMGCVAEDKDCKPDEKPAHEVTISNGFRMTRTEVTVEGYSRFVRETGHPKPPPTKTNYGAKGTELPITNVTWEDAKDYCQWVGGRLPTEAEWEYAARGGKPDWVYPWGAWDPSKANYFGTDVKRMRAPFDELVAVRQIGDGNGYDLYGMAGNAAEWTADWYSPTAYISSPATDPKGPPTGTLRVLRGGSYNDPKGFLRNSARDKAAPGKPVNMNGFRCVVPDAKPAK